MRLAVSFWLWCLSSLAALGAPVPIQTGEHADFTRVVLSIPTGSDWQLGRDDRGYVVRLPVTDGYETDGFYDVIPRDRITEVSQDASTGLLRLAVSCACNANAFLFREDFLVIDIRDGAPAGDSPFEAALMKPDMVGPRRSNFVVPRNSILPIITAPSSVSSVSTSVTVDPTATEVDPVPEQPSARSSTLDADLAELEKSVAESLARALSQGLLATQAPPQEEAPGLDAALRDALADEGIQAPGVKASTSVDEDAVPPDPVVVETQTGDRCLPAAYFEVSNWGDERPFHIQIADARALLTQEFDRTDEQAVTDLARRFVYFGFGREAVQVLGLDGASSQERRYLAALAAIVDGDPVAPDLFGQQVSCATPAALWALLARREGPMDAGVNRAAVMRSFKALPIALQLHLAPELAERFIAIGATAAADEVLDVSRSDPARPVEAELAETALSEALGSPEDAVAALADLATTDPRMTPEAMVDFLNGAVETGAPLRDADFILADAMRFENMGLPIEGDLTVAQARAFLARDRFAEARTLTLEAQGAIGEPRFAVLTEEYVAAAVERMPDAEFLSFAFEPVPRPLSTETANGVVARLLDLGFPDRAEALLPDEGGEDGTYLRARIALDQGNPEAALSALAFDDSPRARALRDVAQDLAFADALVADMTAATDTTESLWRRGEWDGLAGSDDPLLQAASSAVLTPEPVELEPDTPLADGRALLARSEESRAVLDALLDRFNPPSEF